MNFIEALEFLVKDTTDEVIRQHASKLLEAIQNNMERIEKREEKENSYGHTAGMSDKVIIQVQRGENKDG